jgi:hypothetical protein
VTEEDDDVLPAEQVTRLRVALRLLTDQIARDPESHPRLAWVLLFAADVLTETRPS